MENIERETIEITTPTEEHKVVLKKWITGGERRELRNTYLSKMEMGVGKEVQIGKVNSAELIDDTENKAIEIIVVSIDGSDKDILKRLLEMRDKDYSFVYKEIDKIAKDADFLVEEPTPESGIGSEG